ncbi:MAG: hypothetical protein U5L09_03900 [Bacteroidales bacterium]|nr:hypothetical protein [Bacteroidales bacterium]
MNKTIGVFCGSSLGSNPAFADAAEALGSAIVENGYKLVYGGGNIGLMGVLADKVLEMNGYVTGVMPRHLVDYEYSSSPHTGFAGGGNYAGA